MFAYWILFDASMLLEFRATLLDRHIPSAAEHVRAQKCRSVEKGHKLKAVQFWRNESEDPTLW